MRVVFKVVLNYLRLGGWGAWVVGVRRGSLDGRSSMSVCMCVWWWVKVPVLTNGKNVLVVTITG